MRQTIQAESLSIELPAIYKHEFDSEVYEFYDQPSELRIPDQGCH
jgi:hypothetical protein